MLDNVCLGFWSTYLILLCGDVESNPGPNLHNREIFEDYKK